MLNRQFCEEECILYSADYDPVSKNIAGGTVFRSVLIWSSEPKETASKVLFKLEGHAGVIFNVKFLTSDKVASVSDDRSLRLWKLMLNGEYQPLYEFYGHRSRIWNLAILDDKLMCTVSEDATCKIWELPDITEDS